MARRASRTTLNFVARSQERGFTIVELLIVIAVIAILATVSIVGYVGIQNRAYATQMYTAAQSYRRALAIYKAEHGSFPVTTPVEEGALYYACLGTGYSARDSTGSDACRWGSFPRYVDEAFNSALAPYIGQPLDDSRLPPTQISSDATAQGLVYSRTDQHNGYNRITVDGKPVDHAILYYLPFDNGCMNNLRSQGSWNTLVSDPSSREISSILDDRSSACILPLR